MVKQEKGLSARLAAVAAMVPRGVSVADIGADHAELSLYLARKGAHAVIAIEVRRGPYQVACSRVASSGIQGVEVRLGGGLSPLISREVQVVVIAGMGGQTTTAILGGQPEVLGGLERIVLQPMTGEAEVRRWLVENDWQIVDENLVEDGDRTYYVVAAEPGKQFLNEKEFAVGPILLKGHPLLMPRLHRELALLECAMKEIAHGRTSRAAARWQGLINRYKILKEVEECLSYAEK